MSENPQNTASIIREALESLEIDPLALASCNWPVYEEAQELVIADVSRSGRKHLLMPAAAKAWAEMKAKAHEDSVSLIIVSAFRSVERQVEILRKKLNQGLSMESILMASAPPGFSEHHTGRAVDIGTVGCPPLSTEFDKTSAYTWLTEHAEKFGYKLSYPKESQSGFCYEPWHWCHETADA